MQDLLEKAVKEICGAALQGVYGEGRRLMRIKAFSVVLQVVQGFRLALILQYVLMSACFLWALSFFASGYLLVEHWEAVRTQEVPRALYFTLGSLGLATLVLSLTVSQRGWVRALRLQERIDELSRPDSGSYPSEASNLSEQDIAALVDRVVERKLRDREAS